MTRIILFATCALVLLFAVLTVFSFADRSVENASKVECAASANSGRVRIEGGVFTMGAGALYSEEGPSRRVSVPTFWIDRYEVTNRQFSEFVAATGYITVVERALDPKMNAGLSKEQLLPGSAVFHAPTAGSALDGVWDFVVGANWAQPRGPGSDIEGQEEYPVIHIAYEDAVAYANWAGGMLPTEDHWEFAARGGIDGATYSWGEKHPDDRPRAANTWQGIFPIINTAEDGFVGLAPIGCYEPNGYGLHDMTGNVWEWVTSQDDTEVMGRIKGGSFLCAENYCRRFRPAARHAQEKNFSASHVGFRVIYDEAK